MVDYEKAMELRKIHMKNPFKDYNIKNIEVPIENVRLLRERTGVGVLWCKQALQIADNDIEVAYNLLDTEVIDHGWA